MGSAISECNLSPSNSYRLPSCLLGRVCNPHNLLLVNRSSSAGIPPGYSVLNPPLQSQIPGIAQYHATSPSDHKIDQEMVINAFQHQQAKLPASKSAYEQENFARKISQTQMSHPQVVQHQTQPAILTDNQRLMMSLPMDHKLFPS
ncbi:hypothetical protein J6590_079148 [Homalodisca vitripennis]|nr:hypothetical protein J6590_079148 [Homalodisca vitripennis]